MTSEDWQNELTPAPRLLDADAAHEIEVARITTGIAIQRASDGLDEIIDRW